jgi:hypothetical protein
MMRRGLWLVALAAVLLIGYVNLNNNEVQAPAFLIVGFGAVLGFAHPRRAWAWALMLGLAIPVSYILGFMVNYPIVDRPHDLYPTLIALVPAFIGAYAGALARWTIGHASPGRTA